jgi:hypothetical protein
MKFLIIVALILVAGPTPQGTRHPEKRVIQGNGTSNTDNAAKAARDEQNANNQALRTVRDDVIRIEQEIQAQKLQATASNASEEISVQRKLARYTKWLVFVGGLQFVALVAQAFLFWRTLIAVTKQAGIMDAQARTMDAQLAISQPRLNIDEVFAVGFEENQLPVLFVKIVNSGLVAAENVSVSVEVEFINPVKYPRDQVMMIPAKGTRDCHIRFGTTLSNDILRRLDRENLPLRIRGHVGWNNELKQYCYKYNPWPSDQPRPRGFPLFVPCDFDINIMAGVTVEAKSNFAAVTMLGTPPSTPK